MNGKVAKKIRQAAHRELKEFYAEVKALPFIIRLRIAWIILTRKGKK